MSSTTIIKNRKKDKFRATTIEEVELIYTLLRQRSPNKQIDINFNYNSKQYTLSESTKIFISDPDVPLSVDINVVYGDSVTGQTPLLLRDPTTNKIHIETIQSIMKNQIDYPAFKMFDKTIRLEKTYSKTHYQVWTDKGWNPIKKVIRHKTHKKIYKIFTHTGMIEVTEDHSLLDENCKLIKPTECNLDTKLLSSYPNYYDLDNNNSNNNENKSLLYGFFYGSGNCIKSGLNGTKSSWVLTNSDINSLIKVKNLLEIEYSNTKFTIDTIKNTYKLTCQNPDKIIDEYIQAFYDSYTNKKVPTEILNNNNETIKTFLSGYLMTGNCTENKSQIESAGMYFLIKKLGYNVCLNIQENNPDNVTIDTFITELQNISLNQIKQIYVQDYGEIYVYDLETELGRFNAGIGDIQAKNTDSIFIKHSFNRQDHVLNRKDTFKLAIACGDNITETLFKRPPICLEFEKVYQPFILLTKKRYIGKKFEDIRDPMKLKTLTTSGIAITRRDYCNMVKKCYKEVINSIMDNTNLEDAVEIFKHYIDQIENYQIDINELIVSSTLAKNYSCSTCKQKCEWHTLKCENSNCGKKDRLPKFNNVVKRYENCPQCKTKFKCLHTFNLGPVNLAVNMLKRNEEINVNDRIPYLLVEKKGFDNSKKALLAEDPKYAKENNLQFNRSCYLEQLAKPIAGFLKVCLKQEQTLLVETIEYINQKLIEFGGKKLKVSDYQIDENE
jgi:hypothetical protein